MTDSASCSACNPVGCTDMSGTMLLKKLKNMLSDNYTMIIVMILIVGVLGLVLYYFVYSLSNTLYNYAKNKKVADAQTSGTKNISENQRDTKADNEIYYEEPKDDPEKQDAKEFIDKGKKAFIEEVGNQYKEINTLKTEYINSNFNGKQNDDVIDDKILYKEHDNYTYDLAKQS